MGKATLALATLGTLAVIGLVALNLNNQSAMFKKNGPSEIEKEYAKWCAKYNRNHNGKDDYVRRLHQFADNKKLVDGHNEKKTSYSMTLNLFADWYSDEYKALQGNKL